jgi:hypothetical protein
VSPTLAILLIVLWFGSWYTGWDLGQEKNRHGFWWAFFLGWIGVLIVSRLKPRPVKIPPAAIWPRI